MMPLYPVGMTPIYFAGVAATAKKKKGGGITQLRDLTYPETQAINRFLKRFPNYDVLLDKADEVRIATPMHDFKESFVRAIAMRLRQHPKLKKPLPESFDDDSIDRRKLQAAICKGKTNVIDPDKLFPLMWENEGSTDLAKFLFGKLTEADDKNKTVKGVAFNIVAGGRNFVMEYADAIMGDDFLSFNSLLGSRLNTLRAAYPRAKEAADTLVNHNIRLAVKEAKKYIGRGLDIEDLLEEAAVGLLRGIYRYDPTQGNKISTYVTNWIKQNLSRPSMHPHTIYTPAHVDEFVIKVSRARIAMSNGEDEDSDPSPEALFAYCTTHKKDLGMSKKFDLDDIAGALRILRQRRVLDIDRPAPDDPGERSGDLIEDERTVDPEAGSHESEQSRAVADILKFLVQREREVIMLRYGLGFPPGVTAKLLAERTGKNESDFPDRAPVILEDVGKLYGITRERIRQIEARGLLKLQRRCLGNRELALKLASMIGLQQGQVPVFDNFDVEEN